MSLFFLMCSERSGSNFLTKLMNGHSNICGPFTKHIINPVARNIFRYEPLTNEKNWKELIIDIFNLLNVNFAIWKKKFTLNELYSLAPKGDIASLIRNIFYEEAKQYNKQHVFIKENQIYTFFFFLILNFAESKYIYQVRDPRDMALSWKKNPNHPGGVVNAARQWQKDQQNTLKIHNELCKLKKSFFIKYEDLIEDPLKKSKELTNFLGVPHEQTILNFYKDDNTKKNSQLQTAWSNLSKPVISTNKNKYIKELNEEEILVIEKICWNEMKRLCYSPEHSENTINKYSDEKLIKFEQYENEKILIKRTTGVIDNMNAKKIFYKKIIQ